MTTEVAIINREAIALAADSAVTVEMVNNRKIYNSANKLFALSQHYPVGIMIYGNAKLAGVPWEALIKVYRQENSNTRFPYLRDYASHFLSFIENHHDYFLQKDKEASIYYFSIEVFGTVKKDIESLARKLISQNGEIKKSEKNRITRDVIEHLLKTTRNLNPIKKFENVSVSSLVREYSASFNEAIDIVFQDYKLTNRNRENLEKLAAYSLKCNIFYSGYSGIVFAGFGEKEMIPDLITYQANAFVGGKLRLENIEGKSYYNRPDSIIIPFAQEDVIFTFIAGISPDLESISKYLVQQTLSSLEASFPSQCLEKKGLNKQEILEIKKEIFSGSQSLIEVYSSNFQDFKQKIYIEDALNIVSILPKEELAEMAESLVSLTSLRRKVSNVDETVGGPTDVALITKGDGFVWIKRKHYFDAKINSDFFAKKNRSMYPGVKGGDNDSK